MRSMHFPPRSRLHRRRAAMLCLAICPMLLSSGCATGSMKASHVRTERPELPARSTDLSRTEKLKPLTATPRAGDEVRISRNVLEEVFERLGEAIGAVERGNNRILGNNRLWDCAASIFRTGKTPAGCAQPN